MDIAPVACMDWTMWLDNLGNRLGDRFSHTKAIAGLEETRKHSTAALHYPAPTISVHILAGRYLLFSIAILQDKQLYTIAKTAIDFISLLTARSLDKKHLIFTAVELSSDAPVMTLHVNKGC